MIPAHANTLKFHWRNAWIFIKVLENKFLDLDTARGPSMSSGPGKICVLGRETIAGEDVFALKFLQGRNEDWCDRVFFAKYDEKAAWIDQLTPALVKRSSFLKMNMHTS